MQTHVQSLQRSGEILPHGGGGLTDNLQSTECLKREQVDEYQRALHDAFKVDEIQVICSGRAGGAVTHCIQNLGYCSTRQQLVQHQPLRQD